MKPNSRILLIAPAYFGYYKMIMSVLEQQGYTVDFLEDKNSGLFYTICTKSYSLLKKYKERYQKEVLSKLDSVNYDCLLVIGGKTPNLDFWKHISESYTFKKILYQWDSFKNFDYRAMIPYFDVVKTFDSQDAKELNIGYLPLFYKKPDKSDVVQDLDFVFIGIWHSNRIEILNEIAKYADAKGLKYHFRVFHPWYIHFYMVHLKKTLQASVFFTSKTIPLGETVKYYKRAKCIVDINHPWQSGLTMRTIETIGNGKKLLTTNSYIKSEPFYDPKMIQVIDRENVTIDTSFFDFDVKYKDVERLEISNWVKELLN
ncbi:hypothetical protein [Flavobacterium suzhouense]|uniref:Uncharacterized protein n=1 Tax=Flavobacterium suzhouense TaxID=1529638 RepID=A0ABW5NQN8_9FLAO